MTNCSLNSTDSLIYDEIINPFNLNISYNYLYLDEDKNNCSFIEIDINGYEVYKKILVILKCMSDLNECIYGYKETHYNDIADCYDCTVNFSLEKHNNLIL